MRRLPRALAVLLAALVVSACWSDPVRPSPAPSATPEASVPLAETTLAPTSPPSQEPSALMSVETRGGLCATGSCNRLVNIQGDGTIHEVIPKDRILGHVPQPLLDTLQLEIARADYRALKSHRFTGTCPTAVDGQESVYTFHVATGDQELASCTVAIDPNNPLFKAAAAALGVVIP